jgi:hypothetical protein
MGGSPLLARDDAPVDDHDCHDDQEDAQAIAAP